jgi:hypothetical protein
LLAGGAALLGLALAVLAALGRRGHDVLIVVIDEPRPGDRVAPGPVAAPRWDRLSGRGLRVPFRAENVDTATLIAQLRTAAPGRSEPVVRIARSLGGVGADAVDGDAQALVDGTLAAVATSFPRAGTRGFVLSAWPPTDRPEADRALSRLLDGVAPYLLPKRMVLLVVDRGADAALLITPRRPPPLPARLPADGMALASLLREALR